MTLVQDLTNNLPLQDVIANLKSKMGFKEAFLSLIESYKIIKDYPQLKELTDLLVIEKTVLNSLKDAHDLVRASLDIEDKAWICAQSVADKIKKIESIENPFNFALYSACKNNAPDKVIDSFLNKASYLLMKNTDGFTCLHWAIRNNNIPLINKLILRLNKERSYDHNKMIFQAIKMACTADALDALFSFKTNIKAKGGKDRGSYLHRAVRFAPHLIASLIDKHISLSQQNLRFESPLDLASRKNIEYMEGYKQLLIALIKRGMQEQLNPVDLLSYYILNNRPLADIEACLHMHPNILRSDKDWLEFALRSGHNELEKLVAVMVENGASCTKNQWLDFAVKNTLWAEIRAITRAAYYTGKISQPISLPREGEVKIFQQALYLVTDSQTVSYLIDLGVPFANPNLEGNNGFHLAAKHGLITEIDPLLQQGIDPKALNRSFVSPFKMAIEFKQWAFFFKLAEKVAPPAADIEAPLLYSLHHKLENIDQIYESFKSYDQIKFPIIILLTAIESGQLHFIQFFSECENKLELDVNVIQNHLTQYSQADLEKLMYQAIWSKKWEYIPLFLNIFQQAGKVINHALDNGVPFDLIQKLIEAGDLSINSLFCKVVYNLGNNRHYAQYAKEFLNTYEGLSLYMCDNKNRTIVHWAAIHGLLAFIPKIDSLMLDQVDSDNKYPLQWADSKKKWAFIKGVIEALVESTGESFEALAIKYKCCEYVKEFHPTVSSQAIPFVPYAEPKFDDEDDSSKLPRLG